MYAVSFAIVFFFIWLNLRQALLNGGVPAGRGLMPRALMPATARRTPRTRAYAAPAPFGHRHCRPRIAWFAASAFFTQWDTWLRFRYGGDFGMTDPLYGIDVGFYVFICRSIRCCRPA